MSDVREKFNLIVNDVMDEWLEFPLPDDEWVNESNAIWESFIDAGLVIVSREDLVLGTTRGPSWDKDGIAQRYAAVNRLRAAIAPPVTEIES
jgi:hypothetical protein